MSAPPTAEEVATMLTAENLNIEWYKTQYKTASDSITSSLITDAYNSTTVPKRDFSALKKQLDAQTAAITGIKLTNTALKRMLGAFKDAAQNSSILTDKSAVQALRKSIEKDREIAELRDIQTESLENRDAANFHTSWMGLMRPMKEKSRTGLFVAAIGFLIIGIFIGVYLFRTYYSGTGAVPDFLPFSIFKGVGGRRMRK